MICHVKFLTVFGLAIALGINAASAMDASDDWPQWRGPNRDDHSSDTGLLKTWPQGGPKLLWKASGLGRGYSGVSLAGDRLFTMGDQGDASNLIAVRPTDGHILWRTKVGKPGARAVMVAGTALYPDRRRPSGHYGQPIRSSAVRRC